MQTLVVGGTGFLGLELMPRLCSSRPGVGCLVRPTSRTLELPPGVETVPGDLAEPTALQRTLEGVSTVVHLTNLLWADMPAVVKVYRSAGVKRAVFIGTTSIYTSIHPHNRKVRLEAEQAIAESGLEWTVLRPTMIYGNPRDGNISRLILHIHRWGLVPLVRGGAALQQPVHVRDVACAVVACLRSSRTCGRAYNIGGAKAVPYRSMVEIIANLIGRKARTVNLPLGPAVGFLRAAERLHIRLPVTSAQLFRLAEDKAFAWDEAARDFGYAPVEFAEGVVGEIEEMGLLKGGRGTE
jgi:nucleoside-diphosphate-sugar epimerase